MTKRKNVHVVQRGDQWGPLREGGRRVTKIFDTQKQAIEAAKNMAKQGKGELIIHGWNGKIRARDSYGGDLCPPRDTK